MFLLYFTNSPEWFWIELWFMLEILVLTALTRTTSFVFSLSTFAQGLILGFGATYLLDLVLNIDTGTAMRSTIMPIAEEIFKLLPLFAAMWFIFRQKKTIMMNLSDYLLLGVMGGAGFGMLEKYLWGDPYFPFTYGPHIGDTYFFSDALGITVDGAAFGYIGHAAATGFIAMGIGLGIYLKTVRKHSLWWALPLATFAWVTLEHILSNLYYATGSSALHLMGGGQLTPYLFLILMVVILVIDRRNTKEVLKKPHLKKRLENAAKKIKDLSSLKKFLDELRLINLLGYYNKLK